MSFLSKPGSWWIFQSYRRNLHIGIERARTALAEGPDRWQVQRPSDGWFAYAYDPNDLIRVFDTLWLKDGFAPRAYEPGGSSRGII